jgi:hypothetical protein
MDPRPREVPERGPPALGDLPLDALDLAERLARIGTLVVAVLDDQPRRCRTANVIDGLVERLDHRLLPARGLSKGELPFLRSEGAAAALWMRVGGDNGASALVC